MKKSSLILGTLMGLVISVTTVSAAMATKPFTDVPTDHWAYQAVEAGRLTGLWEGYADGTFGRDKSITRAEVAVAMYRNNQMMMDKMSVMQKAMDDKLAAMEKRVAEMEKGGEVLSSEQMGYIKKVYVKDGKEYIDFDYVQWLSWNVPADREQIINDAEKDKPGACDVEADCMPPNGMIIKNETNSTKTFEITDSKISLLNDNVDGYIEKTYTELEAIFNEADNPHEFYPFTIKFNGDVVSSVKEIYSPV